MHSDSVSISELDSNNAARRSSVGVSRTPDLHAEKLLEVEAEVTG